MPSYGCPCCGYLTLNERGFDEICGVCFWEDDGQDDIDAHVVRGGPNYSLSLWAARTNFLKFGACGEAERSHVHPPSPDEPQVRQWFLLDDIAVELLPTSNDTPWNLLHDAVITNIIRRDDDRVTLCLNLPYLSRQRNIPSTALRIELLGCSFIEHIPYEDKTTTLFPIEDVQTSSKSGNEGNKIVVRGNRYVLRMCYQNLALRFDNGSALALAALEHFARR